MRTRHFTLIELLVVVAIISILASMLLPALGKARGKSRTTFCSNLLKQMQVANTMYADEQDDQYVCLYTEGATAPSQYWYQNQTYRALLGLGTRTSYYSYWEAARICPDAAYALLNPPMPNTGDIDVSRAFGFNREGSTYPSGGSGDSICFTLSNVLRPEARFALADSTNWMTTWGERSYWLTSGKEKPVGGSNNKGFAYRHNDAANVAFYDNHVETLSSSYLISASQNTWNVLKR